MNDEQFWNQIRERRRRNDAVIRRLAKEAQQHERDMAALDREMEEFQRREVERVESQSMAERLERIEEELARRLDQIEQKVIPAPRRVHTHITIVSEDKDDESESETEADESEA